MSHDQDTYFFNKSKIRDAGKCEIRNACFNQQPPQPGGAVPALFGLGQNGCWPS